MASHAPDSDSSLEPDWVAGREWVVDASGCDVAALQSLDLMRAVCERVVQELELQVVGIPLWRQFPDPGGVTGLCLLSESHLACHTWPERGLATFNLFCCRQRREWPWGQRLQEMLAAKSVSIRVLERGAVTSEVAQVLSSGGTT